MESTRAATPQARIPWLAHDVWRHGVSLVIAVVFVTLVTFATTLGLTASGDAEIREWLLGPQITVTIVGLMLLLYGVCYLALTAGVFRRHRGERLREVAAGSAASSEERRMVLMLMGGDEIVFPVTTVLMTLGGVVWIVLVPEFTSNLTLMIGAIAGLAGGWLMMVASFSVTYLREWALRDSVRLPEAGAGAGSGTGAKAAELRADERRFSDFFYVAVQFATSYSPTDFSLVGPRVRKLATLNSILAFLYGTVIIAMFLSFAVSVGFAA